MFRALNFPGQHLPNTCYVPGMILIHLTCANSFNLGNNPYEKGYYYPILLLGNPRYKKLARVHMVKKGQRWDLIQCSGHIVLEVGTCSH